MVKAELNRQLMIQLKNTTGTLADITNIISSSGINMIALCAYALENTVAIMFVTEDNNEAKRLLEEKGFDVQEEEVILLTIENKPGALRQVTNKIAEAGIGLNLMYGSTDPNAETSPLVLISQNNLDVMMIIKTELERT